MNMIRVISLKNAYERREAFSRDAQETTLQWAFFDAHREPAPFLNNDLEAQRHIFGVTLQPLEVAVYSSHAALWVEFLASKSKQLLVFEDDVAVDWRYIEMLTQHNFAAAGVCYIRLFSKIPSRKRRIHASFLSRYHGLFQNLDLALGTQAYLLTREGAIRMLEHCKIVRRPIDREMDRVWAHSIPNLEIFPSQMFERFVPSSVGDERLDRDRSSRYRIVNIIEKLRKIAYRLTPRPLVPAIVPLWHDQNGRLQ